jgi:hypothetical protein
MKESICKHQRLAAGVAAARSSAAAEGGVMSALSNIMRNISGG